MSLPPPPPPPGPGVHPPFPAPPFEGRGKRIGTSVGIAAGIVALVCGVGAVAGIGFATSVGSALDEQADVVVSRYLDELRERDFDGAYGLLCQDAQDTESLADFTARMADTEPFESYRVGDLSMGVRLTVPVVIVYPDGDSTRLRADLVQNRSTGKFEVCDLGE
ncbi:hypothetical protein Aph02nite_86400 [Actinoplanes philippinensis]|uniref:DUF4878 domain-containing protein n=1 Tax=Actinoplanes philippinensis TaxID=35752 RepID=A0A1I2LQC2_9ACTN|nr:hypothetical protein [Actinoplanes philippinensis]GIE82690.1 hypothetical protein Aph02nite_86400 [Actinoplanes philippinensis]SFF80629.1 hypothetical protein SAMN05421541_1237 [Actinoplanes philippinensis]